MTVEDYDNRLDMSVEEKAAAESLHVAQGMHKLVGSVNTDWSTPVCTLHHNDFVSGYSHHHRMPLWSAFTLTANQVD